MSVLFPAKTSILVQKTDCLVGTPLIGRPWLLHLEIDLMLVQKVSDVPKNEEHKQ